MFLNLKPASLIAFCCSIVLSNLSAANADINQLPNTAYYEQQKSLAKYNDAFIPKKKKPQSPYHNAPGYLHPVTTFTEVEFYRHPVLQPQNLYETLKGLRAAQLTTLVNNRVTVPVGNDLSCSVLSLAFFNQYEPDFHALEAVDIVHGVENVKTIVVKLFPGAAPDVLPSGIGMFIHPEGVIRAMEKRRMLEDFEKLTDLSLNTFKKISKFTPADRDTIYKLSTKAIDAIEHEQPQDMGSGISAEPTHEDRWLLANLKERHMRDIERPVIFSSEYIDLDNIVDNYLSLCVKYFHVIVYCHPEFSKIIPDGKTWIMYHIGHARVLSRNS